MYFLFDTGEQTLYDIFKAFSEDGIKESLELRIYSRGLEYFKYGCVSNVEFNRGKTKLTAAVRGSDDYTVVLTLNEGEVRGSCTCPYGGICKHQAAVLLYAVNNLSEIDISIQDNTKESIHEYLQSLSKNELISLVEKYAPEQFFTAISNKFADTGTAQHIFGKIERNIRRLFKNEQLLYDIGSFSHALDGEIEKLSGLEALLQKEIEGLIFYLMEQIESAFDEGYLYDDYRDSYYYPSPDFDEFVARYAASLEGKSRISFLSGLDSVISGQSYDTFQDWTRIAQSVFDKDDLPGLKQSFVQIYKDISVGLADEYYGQVCGLMTFEEKEAVLVILAENNSKRLIELAELYDANNHPGQAIRILKTWLQNRNSHYGDENVYFLYLDLLQKGGYELSGIAGEVVWECPTNSMLKKVVSLLPSKSAAYEQVLEQKDAGEFLVYLEKEKRLAEALELIKRTPDIADYQQYDFFKKYKVSFPEDAARCFAKVIDENLAGAGNHYYEAVAGAIRHLMKIDPDQANRLLCGIRTNYRRRRNLIALLEKI